MDRFGTRRVMLVCILMATAGYFALSQAQSMWQVIVVFAVPLGFAYNWAMFNSGAAFINNWFDRHKATALSMLNVGQAAGALVLPLMAYAITSLGWRNALFISGVALLIAGLAVTAIVRNTPEEMGLTPDGEQPRTEAGGRPAPPATGTTLGEAVRTPFFWSISLGSACMLFVNNSIIFHMVPLLGSKGESEGIAASMLSMQLFFTLPIVLITAWAADRLGGTKVLVCMMICTFIGVPVMLAAKSVPAYILASAFLAFGGSHWAILWSVLGRAYGRRHYNSIRMSVYSILIIGSATAPLLAGLSYDATESYTFWLKVLIGVGLAGIATFVVTVKSERAPKPVAAAA
jgi:MFS family permease